MLSTESLRASYRTRLDFPSGGTWVSVTPPSTLNTKYHTDDLQKGAFTPLSISYGQCIQGSFQLREIFTVAYRHIFSEDGVLDYAASLKTIESSYGQKYCIDRQTGCCGADVVVLLGHSGLDMVFAKEET